MTGGVGPRVPYCKIKFRSLYLYSRITNILNESLQKDTIKQIRIEIVNIYNYIENV